MSLFAKHTITVKRVGSNLVANFGCANPPLIWKFDLERNHSFSLAMQGEEGDWELGLTSTKGEFYPVAHFPEREDAEDAMAKVQKILLHKKRPSILMIILIIFFVLFMGCIGLVGYEVMLIKGIMTPHTVGLDLSRASKVAPVPTAPVEVPQGVPLPADDVLKAPH